MSAAAAVQVAEAELFDASQGNKAGPSTSLGPVLQKGAKKGAKKVSGSVSVNSVCLVITSEYI